MEEARLLEAGDSLAYISHIFVALNDLLQITTDINRTAPMETKIVQELLMAAIFPVETKQSKSTFDHLATADTWNLWFIADRVHLRSSFEGLVPLLALRSEVVETILPLLNKLGLEHRMLSKIVVGVPRTEGQSRLHEDMTAFLRAKSRYISRYVCPFVTFRLYICILTPYVVASYHHIIQIVQ
jgi:hypothetical protein